MYGTFNYDVLTQSDLRPVKAIDVGPMFDWFGAYSRFSVGFHPGFAPSVQMDVGRVADEVYFDIIRTFGYKGTGPDIVQAYKFHFLQNELSPDLTDQLKPQPLVACIQIEQGARQKRLFRPSLD
ncbi:MAG: hypothetical protein LBL30_00625 [Holosporales bacterium]|jgi:N-acetyl-anhydromuramyl-L-alanine amidase AmpD|nr:hypothetical protein [Holosporales bacterium]